MPQACRRTERQHHLKPRQTRIMKIGRKPLANLSRDAGSAKDVRSDVVMKAGEIRVNQRGGETCDDQDSVASNSLTVSSPASFASCHRSSRVVPCHGGSDHHQASYATSAPVRP